MAMTEDDANPRAARITLPLVDVPRFAAAVPAVTVTPPPPPPQAQPRPAAVAPALPPPPPAYVPASLPVAPYIPPSPSVATARLATTPTSAPTQGGLAGTILDKIGAQVIIDASQKAFEESLDSNHVASDYFQERYNQGAGITADFTGEDAAARYDAERKYNARVNAAISARPALPNIAQQFGRGVTESVAGIVGFTAGLTLPFVTEAAKGAFAGTPKLPDGPVLAGPPSRVANGPPSSGGFRFDVESQTRLGAIEQKIESTVGSIEERAQLAVLPSRRLSQAPLVVPTSSVASASLFVAPGAPQPTSNPQDNGNAKQTNRDDSQPIAERGTLSTLLGSGLGIARDGKYADAAKQYLGLGLHLPAPSLPSTPSPSMSLPSASQVTDLNLGQAPVHITPPAVVPGQQTRSGMGQPPVVNPAPAPKAQPRAAPKKKTTKKPAAKKATKKPAPRKASHKAKPKKKAKPSKSNR